MPHPFAWLPRRAYKPVLWYLVVVSVAFAAYLDVQGRPLTRAGAPLGIVSFELAPDSAAAATVLNAWSDIGPTVRTQVEVDFAFVFAYPLALSLACAVIAMRRGRWSEAALVLSWAVLLTCGLDTAEDIALMHMLSHGPSDVAATVASTAAALKFALFIPTLVFLATAGVIAVIRMIRGESGERRPALQR